MKKILNILWTITLTGTSTTSLVACNKPKYSENELMQLKEKNNIKIKDIFLEWMTPQEKIFSKINNKYYFVVWRGNENLEWKICKFKNTEKIRLKRGFKLVLDYYGKVDDPNKINLVFDAEINNLRANDQIWTENSINFKAVYCWNGNINSNIDIVIKNKLKSYLDL